LKEARENNKERLYHKHWLQPKAIKNADWMLVYGQPT
jgi:hypothetical protein